MTFVSFIYNFKPTKAYVKYVDNPITKGQLISECLELSKKPTQNLMNFCPKI